MSCTKERHCTHATSRKLSTPIYAGRNNVSYMLLYRKSTVTHFSYSQKMSQIEEEATVTNFSFLGKCYVHNIILVHLVLHSFSSWCCRKCCNGNGLSNFLAVMFYGSESSNNHYRYTRSKKYTANWRLQQKNHKITVRKNVSRTQSWKVYKYYQYTIILYIMD